MLAPLAQLLMGIPATSVSSERTWSETKLIDTRLRSSLGNDLFGDLVFIAKNLPPHADLDSFMKRLFNLSFLAKSTQDLLVGLDNDNESSDDDNNE